MKSLLKISLLAMMTCVMAVVPEEQPKTPAPIAKDAKHPPGVNVKLMSEDPSYGYSEENPIKVGRKEGYGGPIAQREYLDSLVDSTGKPIRYARMGSAGRNQEGMPLDIYAITLADGRKFHLWLDMYHPENRPDKQPAPVGFYKKGG